MRVIVYIENDGDQIKKATLDAIAFGHSLNIGEIIGLSTNQISDSALLETGKYGLEKIYKINNDHINSESTNSLADAITKLAEENDTNIVVLGHTLNSENIAAKIAIRRDAAIVTNVISIPEQDEESITLKRSNYTGKAYSKVLLNTPKAVITVKKGSLNLKEINTTTQIENIDSPINPKDNLITIKETTKVEGDVLLPDAEIVVSAGRGLKGPENWNMIEELAKKIGAATACSKPVSDADWRPHHEHVGQTGLKISPQLYIAIGISGAIQHLAGVSASKKIVVINTDSEAPFFKAADYGIVGDAFEVVPKLIAALGE